MNKRKQNNIFTLIIALVLIVLLNLFGSKFYYRLDLTAEKRYSLSDVTKVTLDNVQDVVFFRVYLEGDFPAGFKRLRNATKEMLDEFRAYNKNIQYEFINPSDFDNPQERNAFYQELVRSGLQPTDLYSSNTGENRQQIIFPGAIVVYNGNEAAMPLLISQMGMPPETILNNSLETLEFTMANTISKLQFKLKPRVAILKGHGELDKLESANIATALTEYYEVERVNFVGHINSFTERKDIDSLQPIIRNKYEALIIAKPDSAFSEQEKFILDQFIMRGGKILWVIDPVFAEMDSIQSTNQTVSVSRNLRLDDLLFGYGCRINNNLVLDLNSNQIPIVTGNIGGQPQQQFFNWHYFPILIPDESHPINSNINSLKTEFISSIDTIKVNGIKKTPLLKTSKYSKVVNSPALIDLELLKQQVDPEDYTKEGQIVALLLEGSFKSAYRNRMTEGLYNNPVIGFVEESVPTKMIVISDGDIIKNQIDYRNGYALPLGYDKYTRKTFGNKEFIMNAMSYLLDDSGLIEVRAKDVKLRMLNKTKVTEERLIWQVINIVVPILIVLLFAFVQLRIRKNKYGK